MLPKSDPFENAFYSAFECDVLALVSVFVITVQLVFGVHRLVFVFVIVLSDTSMSHLFISLRLEIIKVSTYIHQ